MEVEMTQALSPARASLALLRGAYPNATITAETVQAYEAALADLDAQDVFGAVTALVKESQFMPTIAEIRQVVAERKLALPTPTEAWVEAQGRANGTWDKPRHPLVHKAIQAVGGTYSIKTSENPSITQSQFLKHYNELRRELLTQFVRTGELPTLPELPPRMTVIESGDQFVLAPLAEDSEVALLTDGDFDGIRRTA
jgi:hypothetical protein